MLLEVSGNVGKVMARFTITDNKCKKHCFGKINSEKILILCKNM
jgi:hypothetical protein